MQFNLAYLQIFVYMCFFGSPTRQISFQPQLQIQTLMCESFSKGLQILKFSEQ